MVLAAKIDVSAQFHIGHIGVTVAEIDETDPDAQEVSLIGIAIRDFAVRNFTQRTYDKTIELDLGAIEINDYIAQGSDSKYVIESNPKDPLPGQKTVDSNVGGDALITVKVVMVEPKSPLFAMEFASTKMAVDASFGRLRVYGQLKTLKKLMAFADATFATDDTKKTPELPEPEPEATEPAAMPSDLLAVPGAKKRKLGGKKKKKDRAHREADHGWVEMKIAFSAGSFEALVRAEDKNIASFVIAGLQADVTKSAIALDVNAKLNDLCVLDHTNPGVERAIVSVVGEEVFTVKAHVCTDDASFRELLQADITAEVNINGISIVFLNKFVSHLTNFAASIQPPPKAETKVVKKIRRKRHTETVSRSVASFTESIASGVSQKTKPSTQDDDTLGTKIQFSVQIKAPVVHVPLSSTSDRELVLDFGKIDISNELKAAPRSSNPLSSKAVMDDLRLALTDLSVYFVSTGDKDKRTLIKPVTLEIQAVRCLLPAFHDVPAISASGEIAEFAIQVSDREYADIMAITTGNLAEAIPPPPPQEPVPAKASLALDAVESSTSTDEDESVPPTPVDAATSGTDSGDAGHNLPTIKVEGRPRSVSRAVLEAQQIAAEQEQQALFTATNAKFVLQKLQISLIKDDAPLADLELNTLDIGLDICSDGAMDAKVLLKDLTIADSRAYEPKPYPHLLTRVAQDSEGLLSVQYAKHGLDQSARISLNKPRINLAPNFLLALQGFMELPGDGDDTDEDEEKKGVKALEGSKDVEEDVQVQEEVVQAEESGTSGTALKVSLSLVNPQVRPIIHTCKFKLVLDHCGCGSLGCQL